MQLINDAKELKLLFINPCLRRGANLKMLPVGLGSVMTYVKKMGFDFTLLDVDINEYDDEYVESYIRDNYFDVILYGSIVTHYAWMKWLTHTIKNHQPNTVTVIGNSVAASCVDVFMANAPVDIVVHGEGEITCVKVLEALSCGNDIADVEGISFRDTNGNIFKSKHRKACDINILPMPEWELFNTQDYFATSNGVAFGSDNDKAISMPVSTARGCAFKCTFCHFVFWDDPYRHRQPELVMEEIARNKKDYGATFINFWDDLSFGSIRQVERMLDAIEHSGLEFEWSAAVRTDLFGREKMSYQQRVDIAKRMKDLGCSTLGYSLESGNAEILDMMNKHVKREYFAEQIEILREAGITSNVSVVFGYPIETKETIQETFDMCLEARVYPSIGYLLPLPYTGMYDYAKEQGFITDEDAFLTSITERQDLCLNMTKMEDQEVLDYIAEGASELNEMLDLGLSKDKLVKTGGYKKHTNKKKLLATDRIDPEKLVRNENDFSFNYSQSEFDMSEGS